MTKCVFCLEAIDDDSFYCDMCGKEIKTCPDCKQPGKAKYCTNCRKPLITAKMQQSTSNLGNSSSIDNAADILKTVFQPDVILNVTRHITENPKPPNVPELRLINDNINVNIRVEDGDIIGRSTGQHVNIFSKYGQVSGRHCQFNYDHNKGWFVTDLGSTYKTAYNNQELVTNKPQNISDQALLKLASSGVIENGKVLQGIEFLIRVIATEIKP